MLVREKVVLDWLYCCRDRRGRAGVARAAARDSRGARAVWDVRARVEQRRELRVATGGWSACFCRLARRACCRLLRVFNAPRRG